jgi:hypothetical protein
MTRACMTKRISRENRDAFGRECDKFNDHGVSNMAGDFPERSTTLAKRSERKAQTFVAPSSSAFFGSDSRGEEFLC